MYNKKGIYKTKNEKHSISTLIFISLFVILIGVLIFVMVNIFNIAPVHNFKTIDINSSTVTLKWDSVNFANNYLVYRAEIKNNGKISNYEKCGDTSTTSIIDNNLKQATKYKYKIYACFSFGGNVLTKSTEQTLKIITQPKTVESFKILKTKTTSVHLSWVNNNKASSYIIERADEVSDNKLGKFKKIKELAKTNSFVDNTLQPSTCYKYRIKAKVKLNAQPLYSKPAIASVMTKIQEPTLECSKTTLSEISLKWNLPKHTNRIDLYRNNKFIKTFINKTEYTDTKLKKGTTYNYAIRSIRTYNNKEYKSKLSTLTASTNIEVPTVPGGLSGTWVEIDIDNQYLKMFVDSKLYVETPVVTGNIYGHSTTKGHHEVISMGSPSRLKGDSWDIMVDYWMGFTYDGQGIHDSTWRSEYGGSIYMGNGSHGCINTPYEAVRKMYSMAYIGMPVIVY